MCEQFDENSNTSSLSWDIASGVLIFAVGLAVLTSQVCSSLGNFEQVIYVLRDLVFSY